jgi:PE family
MSLLIAAPESMTAAATDLANIGSALSAAHTAAATPTVAVIPAAADEVSASIAHLFSQHAQEYQALAGQAAAFQEQFVQHLTSSAGSYASAEAASAASLRSLSAAGGSIAAPADATSDFLLNAVTLAIAIVAAPVIAILLLPFLALVGLGLGLLLGFTGLGLAAGGLAYLAQLIFEML